MYWNITDKERLLQSFEIATSNRKLLENFLNDLFTEKEIEQSVTRLKIACMLYDGASYEKIRGFSGLSPSTIARLSKRFKNKDSGFYKIIEKFLSQGKSQAYYD